MRKEIIIIFWSLIFFKSLLWLFTIPIFQSPDEISHFAYIQKLAETDRFVNPRKERVTSKELIQVAKVLNFNWGKSHPVWKGYPLGWQKKLDKISFNDRKEFVFIKGQRAHKNPPFYYILSAPFYKIFYHSNFVSRFFVLRIFSLIISLLTVLLVYQIGFLFFKNRLTVVSLASLVAFQPMFSFLTVTISNDVISILIGTLFIYFALKAIKTSKREYLFLAFLTVLGSLFVKPILIVLIFAFPFLLRKNFAKGLLVCFALIFLIFIVSFFVLEDFAKTSVLGDFLRYKIAFADYQEILKFFGKSLISGEIFLQIPQYFQANRETYLHNIFPWYWGVFGWLEKTMPLLVYRVLKIVCGLSLIGLILWLTRKFKKGKRSKSLYMVFFLIATIVLFSMGIIFNDFKVFTTTGQAFGIQGRYFLPVIAAQMTLLLLGLKTLIPRKLEKTLFLFLIGGSIGLNIIGFWSMYTYFYG